MRIIEKIKRKANDINNEQAVTIAFIGDSVTQGCFECYTKNENELTTVFDPRYAYSNRVKEILQLLYPSVQFNIINSGINGDNINHGLERLDRDVIAYHPDLTIISFGLNDSCNGLEKLEIYAESLKRIITQLKEKGSEVIFLTENYMNDHTSCMLKDKLFIDLSKSFANIQNDGILTQYFTRAKQVCFDNGAKVCDLHEVWRLMNKNGVNTTELLANKLNHPIREFHYYMAIKLIETMFHD